MNSTIDKMPILHLASNTDIISSIISSEEVNAVKSIKLVQCENNEVILKAIYRNGSTKTIPYSDGYVIDLNIEKLIS